MALGDRGWTDRAENYVDSYVKSVAASTADNVMGIDVNQPVVVFSVTIAHSQALASGDLTLVDTSATGDAGTAKFRAVIASAATTSRPGPFHVAFPRGIYFDSGLIVSATDVTGAITVTYKPRYS